MKKIVTTIFIVVMILTVAGVAFTPHTAEAGWLATLGCAISPGTCAPAVSAGSFVVSLFAEVGNFIIQIVAYFLTLVSLMLNVAIMLTMNIKAIYEATPAIQQVWIVIRNLSSLFIIFGLLYTSIMTILDIGKPNIRALVGKIILAGLFINFSLFFTKIAIDASNLISLQFYRAIAPETQKIDITKSNIGSLITTNPGISDIFMTSLKIPSIFNNKKGLLTGTTENDFLKIAVSTYGGAVLMCAAMLSFLAAAVAFIVRLVVLLLLLGFSPIYFAGMIFPKIKTELSDKWEGWLVGQLTFMPVYLLFMYVALRFISSENGGGFFAALDNARLSSSNSGSYLNSLVGLLIQYGIAYILINIPLLAAIKSGGIATKWGESAKKWVGGAVGGLAKKSVGFAGRNTLGAAASRFSDSAVMRSFSSSNPFLGRVAQGGLSKVSGAGFGGKKGGYDAQVKADKKAMEALDKKVGTVNRYDYATEAEYNAAKAAAKQQQEAYRQNLGSRSLLNRLINGRAGQATSAKLIEDAKKKAAKKNKSDNEKKLKEKKEEISRIDAKLENPYEGTGFGQRRLSDSEIAKLQSDRSKAKEELAKIADELELAKEAEKGDLISSLKDEMKDEDGGKKDEEKKEDKK